MESIDLMTIEEIKKTPEGWPLPYVATKGLTPYIFRLRGDKHIGIEIGTCRGESAHYILERCPNVSLLYTIDPYIEFEDWNGLVTQEKLDREQEIAKKNLEHFGDRVRMIHKKSSDAHDMFKMNSVDFLFVDGDHSYDATLADLINYFPKVKKGGLICGHDYQLDSVRSAIGEFRNLRRVRAPIQITINQAWFLTK